MYPLLRNSLSVDLSRTLGQVLLSSFITTALWGMMCVQAVIYFATYMAHQCIKSLIIVLIVLVSFHEFICIQFLWGYLISNVANVANRSVTHTGFSLEPLITGIVTALAQGFFTWRIWRFSKESKLFPMHIDKLFFIILFPLIVGSLIGFMILLKVTLGTSLESLNIQQTQNLALGVGSVVTTTDVLIAVIMCILLWNGRTGLSVESDRVIVRLMNASMSTGASTACFALISVTLVSILPHDSFYVIGELPLCTMYCNAVLANLDSRRYMRGTNVVDISMSTELPKSLSPMARLVEGGPQQRGDREGVAMEASQDEEQHTRAISAQL